MLNFRHLRHQCHWPFRSLALRWKTCTRWATVLPAASLPSWVTAVAKGRTVTGQWEGEFAALFPPDFFSDPWCIWVFRTSQTIKERLKVIETIDLYRIIISFCSTYFNPTFLLFVYALRLWAPVVRWILPFVQRTRRSQEIQARPCRSKEARGSYADAWPRLKPKWVCLKIGYIPNEIAI